MAARTAMVVLVAIALVGAAGGRARAKEDIDTESAKRHYRLGSELYERGQYAEALEEFKRARVRRPLPAFDYNIALCLDRLDRIEEAIASYQRYLDGGPAGEDVPRVRARIVKLREEQAELERLRRGGEAAGPVAGGAGRGATPGGAGRRAQSTDELLPLVISDRELDPGDVAPGGGVASEPAEAPVSAERAHGWRRPRATSIALLGAALAFGVAGGIAEGVAASRFDTAASTCRPTCSDEVVAGITGAERVGWALLGAAAVATAGAIIYYFAVEPRRARAPSLTRSALVRF